MRRSRHVQGMDLRACRSSVVVALVVLAASPGALAAQNLVRDHERACEGGELSSCTILGLIYESGAGGTRDLPRALELYQRTCDAGIPEGCARFALAQTAPSPSASATMQSGEQIRRGYIADAETGAPINVAVVEIPSLGIRELADEAGRVELGPLPRGRHEVTAGKLGWLLVRGDLPVPHETDFLMLLDRSTPDVEETVGRIVGRVVDEATGRGLPYVAIELARSDRAVLSGPDGRFLLSGLPPGSAEVTFELLGYGTRSTPVMIEAGRVLEVHANLTMQPIELEPIEVRVGSQYLQRSGFYRRSILAMGTQFSRRDLDLFDPLSMSDIILRAPGVTTVTERGKTRVVSSRSTSQLDGAACRLRLYLDGVAMHDWDLELLRPDDLEGVEIYHGASTPVEYQHLMDPDGVYPCGVVLVWTRRNS
jgi:hypothetical protein